MSEEKQRKVFANNLKHYLFINDVMQKDVADAIGVSTQSFNTWCQGIAIPRISKIEMLANYFKIKKTDLLDEHNLDETTNTHDYMSLSDGILVEVPNENDLKNEQLLRLFHYFSKLNESQKVSIETILKGMADND